MEKLYVLENYWLYKIWFTKWTIENRIKSMKTGNPVPIKIHNVYEVSDWRAEEKLLHNKFKNKRVQGEWFKLSILDLQWIDKKFWKKFEHELLVLDKDTEVPWSDYFKQCIDSWISSFNVCLGSNIHPMNYLERITWIKYAIIKKMLVDDTHKWIISIVNKRVLYECFKIGNSRLIFDPNKIDWMLENWVVWIEFIRNWILLVLWESYKLPLSININPKYS